MIKGDQDYEFRPLTEKEKIEFINSLNAEGKQILREFAGEKRTPPLQPFQH